MGLRLELHELLEELVSDRDPSWTVYFQEPQDRLMSYPCITYKRSDMLPRHADNQPYTLTSRYTVTVIDRDPDSEIPLLLAKFPLCRHDQKFVVQNLNHTVFSLYF